MAKLEEIISEKEFSEIIKMYNNNISLREIEKITHHGRAALSKMLERLNIKTIKGNHHRKYFFDFNFFEKIDNAHRYMKRKYDKFQLLLQKYNES